MIGPAAWASVLLARRRRRRPRCESPTGEISRHARLASAIPVQADEVDRFQADFDLDERRE